jgi:hypothetical protein
MAEQKMVNGINVAELDGAMDGMRDNPEVGKYQFRAKNRWVDPGRWPGGHIAGQGPCARR